MDSVFVCSRDKDVAGSEPVDEEKLAEEDNGDLEAGRSWAERVELVDPED